MEVSSDGVETQGGWLIWLINVSELLINPVRIEVLKLLLGINQKVCGRLTRSKLGLRRLQTAGGEVEPKSDTPGTW
ncbi:MAG: hypothetical protein CBARDCOR_6817 [uncultured Caballeronia sp.]|nr:MAG: hypothetical protein CBARDCOR_6817 [uncultured Caballeronia sp.]